MIVDGSALGTSLIGRLAVAQVANNLLVTGMQYQNRGEELTAQIGLALTCALSLPASWHKDKASGEVYSSKRCIHLLARALAFSCTAFTIMTCLRLLVSSHLCWQTC